MGNRALGISLGVDVKVLNDAPGPHRMSAWKPGEGSVACGMLSKNLVTDVLQLFECSSCMLCECRRVWAVHSFTQLNSSVGVSGALPSRARRTFGRP